ncbi:unnamed protein product [Plutella xylostella]|uniref:(diamondback moth) hypothetical protein n=1 Tax=Plutella xylostella TaxID=51655 RepID=A0A8S4G8D2_PLUXY|nr:unnamed protein product [Plutella xylostella]
MCRWWYGSRRTEEEEGEATGYRGKPKSTHDVLEDPKLSKLTAAELELDEDQTATEKSTQESLKKKEETETAVNSIRDKLKKKREGKLQIHNYKLLRSPDTDSRKKQKNDSDKDSDSEEEEYYLGKERDDARRKETDRIKNEIKMLKKEMKSSKEEKDTKEQEQEESSSKSIDNNEMYKQFVDEQEKYKKLKENIPKKGAARESFTLELLAKFKNKLSAIKEKTQTEDDGPKEATPAADDDDDVNGDDWLGHKLRFEDRQPVLAKDASTKGDDWFDIYDPRNPINKRKREEKKNKK